MNFSLKITVFAFLVSQGGLDDASSELDDAMMKDVKSQLKKLQELPPEAFDTEQKLEEHILKIVNYAFSVGCDAYQGLIDGE